MSPTEVGDDIVCSAWKHAAALTGGQGLTNLVEHMVMYGCTAPKLASSLGKPQSEGLKLFNIFWETYPALKHLNDALKRSYKANRCLVGLDGRRISIREERKLLNTVIQSASAVVFKEWLRRNFREIVTRGWLEWLLQIIAYHDEGQYEVRSQHVGNAEGAAMIFCANALQTGDYFNLNVPIEADYKIGKNWGETH